MDTGCHQRHAYQISASSAKVQKKVGASWGRRHRRNFPLPRNFSPRTFLASCSIPARSLNRAEHNGTCFEDFGKLLGPLGPWPSSAHREHAPRTCKLSREALARNAGMKRNIPDDRDDDGGEPAQQRRLPRDVGGTDDQIAGPGPSSEAAAAVAQEHCPTWQGHQRGSVPMRGVWGCRPALHAWPQES